MRLISRISWRTTVRCYLLSAIDYQLAAHRPPSEEKMPLHLSSISDKEERNAAIVSWLLNTGVHECGAASASEDKRFLYLAGNIDDYLSQQAVGRVIFTLMRDEENKQLKLLDIDLIMNNDTPTRVRFLKRREGSSGANEYYNVETCSGCQHMVVETVKRHMEPRSLEGTERDVHISMFPFRLTVYDAMEDFDRAAGISGPAAAGGSGPAVSGFSERFCMPGDILDSDKSSDGNYSFIVGKVKGFRYAVTEFGETRLSFIVARVDTAAGIVPVAMSRDVFDLSKLKKDCIVAMSAYVKADIAACGPPAISC